MRNGRLVFERYFNGSGPDDVHTMQSVTKSFASALVGIAIGQGHISGVEEAVLDFFPQWKAELSQDPRRAAQRLEDVLTMRTGTDYHENGPTAPHWQLNALSSGWDRFWLDRPMITDPGGVWQYDSGGAVAVSSMLEQRTGLHADGFADATLFDALDIDESAWFRNAEGHVHTGGGLNIRARDMIKLGQLYLQGGVWEGEQVIEREWIEASVRQHYTFQNPPPRVTGYGYFWWIMEPDPSGSGRKDLRRFRGARAVHLRGPRARSRRRSDGRRPQRQRRDAAAGVPLHARPAGDRALTPGQARATTVPSRMLSVRVAGPLSRSHRRGSSCPSLRSS